MKKKKNEPVYYGNTKVRISEYNEMMRHIKMMHFPTPTRKFDIGEHVIYGSHDKVEIIEIIEDGIAYIIRTYGKKQNWGKYVDYDEQQIVDWTQLYKIGSFEGDSSFSKELPFMLNYQKTDMQSLLYLFYRGLDLNPEYQRDLVWSEEQKTDLLDSVFNNIEIGKFTFLEKKYSDPDFDWNKGIFYEVIDGKQRLSTIKDFFEDRFIYRGYKYSELSIKDKFHFNSYSILKAFIPEPKDRKDVYKFFVILNTAGVPVSKSHLEKIKKMADEKN